MKKPLEIILAILTLLSASLYCIVKFSKKGVLKTAEKENMELTVGANNNFLSSLFAKTTAFVAPLWFFMKIKTIISDHKKAVKKRRFLTFSAIMIALSAFKIALKNKKSKLKAN